MTKFDPFTLVRYNSETDWLVKWDDRLVIGMPENGATGDTFAGYCEEFEAEPAAGATQTKGPR